MSYDVSFKAKLESTKQWVYVGDDWVNYPYNTAVLIKEVCGSYPSNWDGKSCAELTPILEAGISELSKHSEKYRQFEAENGWTGWSMVETTFNFLDSVLENCKHYPTAVLEISH